MKFLTRVVPKGALPYKDLTLVTRMSDKLFEHAKFLPYLPIIDKNDTIYHFTLDGMPFVKVKGNNLSFNDDFEKNQKALVKLDKTFNTPSSKALNAYAVHSVYFEKLLEIIANSKTQFVYINLLGPFTISQDVIGLSGKQFLNDKAYRKFFIQAVTVKALYIIDKIKEVNPKITPIIMLEENKLGNIGVIKKDNEDITLELVSTMLSRVVEKIKEAGGMVGVHCSNKCDWTVPINAGVDIISYDAYNNPNNLCIFPEQIKEFIANGGKINWCIMPTMTESIVKEMNIDALTRRLVATFEGLVNAGVPAKYVYNSALISIQGDLDKLSIIFAEKALILTSQLEKRIPVVS